MFNDYDPDWPYGFTVDDKPVRVLATDLEGHLPIAVCGVMMDNGFEAVIRFTAQGRGWYMSRPVCLRNRPAPKKRIRGWVNISPSGYGSRIYPNREVADWLSTESRIACVYIDFEEGEGL